MRILHLSDLHLDEKDFDQTIVFEGLITSLDSLRSEKKEVDLVVFSGDLLFSGTKPGVFERARSSTIKTILDSLELSTSQFVICPGNHDIDREVVRRERWVETGLITTLKSREDINGFIDANWEKRLDAGTFPDAFSRLGNFFKEIWIPSSGGSVFANLFAVVHRLQIAGRSVGVCSLNSAWRCTGEAENVDRGNLVLGERVLDRLLPLVSDCEIKLAVFHHPTDWLVEEDRTAVESLLHTHFDLFLFGHVHDASPQQVNNLHGGALYSQAGCIYHTRRYFNGWSLITLNQSDSKATFNLFEYSDRRRTFVPAERLASGGTVTYQLPKPGSVAGNLAYMLAAFRAAIRKQANDHVQLGTDLTEDASIDKHFVAPPIREKSGHSRYFEGLTEASPEPTTIEEILATTGNIAFSGPSECGKTTIAHYMAVKVSEGVCDSPRLPLYARFAELQAGPDALWRAVRSYANEISDGILTKATVLSTPLFVIIDDVDLSDSKKMTQLAGLIVASPSVRWCLFATHGHFRSISIPLEQYSIKDFRAYGIGHLLRRSIRALSANWASLDMDADETDKLFTSVMEHIQRTGLPRSGYIVSLILWTLQNKSAGELLNEAVLLENIIDSLLDKMDYRGALRREFDFVSKVAVLQDLAVFFKREGDIQTENAVVERVIAYLKKKGLSYDGAKVIDGLIRCRVLAKMDDRISFRYSRFRDFFLAGYLRDNPDELASVQAGQNWINYERELDIYSARFRHESKLLNFGRDIVTDNTITPGFNDEIEFEKYVMSTSNAHLAKTRLREMRKKPMTAAKIDHLRDEADSRLEKRTQGATPEKSSKEKVGNGVTQFATAMSALQMYSRFIRNLEFADRSDKKIHLDRCIDAWTDATKAFYHAVFWVFGEIRKENAEDGEEYEKITKEIETFVKAVIPTMISSMAYNVLGTEKLEEMLEDVANDASRLALSRLLAVFVLLEIDPERGIKCMNSKDWSSLMSTPWVAEAMEGRLFRHYLERVLPTGLRPDFEKLAAQIERRLSGKKSGQETGRIIQRWQKQALQIKFRDDD